MYPENPEGTRVIIGSLEYRCLMRNVSIRIPDLTTLKITLKPHDLEYLCKFGGLLLCNSRYKLYFIFLEERGSLNFARDFTLNCSYLLISNINWSRTLRITSVQLILSLNQCHALTTILYSNSNINWSSTPK